MVREHKRIMVHGRSLGNVDSSNAFLANRSAEGLWLCLGNSDIPSTI